MSRIGSSCMDCDVRGDHWTVTEAAASMLAHVFNYPLHRPLVSTPGNGWHRLWLGEP